MQTIIETFENVKRYVPEDAMAAYNDALAYTMKILCTAEPVKPKRGYCGHCGQKIMEADNYCWNCGREIDKE